MYSTGFSGFLNTHLARKNFNVNAVIKKTSHTMEVEVRLTRSKIYFYFTLKKIDPLLSL